MFGYTVVEDITYSSNHYTYGIFWHFFPPPFAFDPRATSSKEQCRIENTGLLGFIETQNWLRTDLDWCEPRNQPKTIHTGSQASTRGWTRPGWCQVSGSARFDMAQTSIARHQHAEAKNEA